MITPVPSLSGDRRDAGAVLRALLLLLGALVLLCVLLLTMAPAGLVARMVAEASPEVRLLSASGRALDGSADLVVSGRGLGRLHWQIDLAPLLRARLGMDLQLAAPGHDASGRLLVASDGSVEIETLDAHLRERTLDELLRPYDIEPAGSIDLEDGSGSADLRRRVVTAANASARWTGGVVRYRLGGGVWTAAFPALDAVLRVRDGAPVLVVKDLAGAELMDLALRRDGWADLRIRYRLVALAGYPWPEPPGPDVVVVEISEQLL